MLESTASKCSEMTPWTRARGCLLFLMLLLVTGMMIIFYTSSTESSWPLNFRGTDSGPYNMNTEGCSVSTDQCFVAYPHQYYFRVDEPDRCWKEKPFLVLIVPVAPHDREARDIIRNTWSKESTVLGRVVNHYFLLGLSKDRDESGDLEDQVLQESQTHRDILQSDFVDSYDNLTIKTMVMFEWLSSHCPNTSYAMKIDSDIFLNVHNLVDMLIKAPRHLYMTGLVVRSGPVLRNPNSKWFMPPSVFAGSVYPPYVMGLGYVFSMDLPQKILEASKYVRAVYIEDVYVGLCMRHLGIALTDPPQSGLFKQGLPFFNFGCYWTSVIATILQNSNQLQDVWGTYQTELQNGC